MAKEIAKHDEDISTWKGDSKVATLKDYTEPIDARDEGIQTLKAQAHEVMQAVAPLIQVSSSSIVPAETKSVIGAFLAKDLDENSAVPAPEANAYGFQAQGMVDMLKTVGTKFEDERTGKVCRHAVLVVGNIEIA